MDDVDILHHISALVEEEQQLRQRHGLGDKGRARMQELETQLDQCWDLLRRREAREEFAQDPDLEGERPTSVIEHYLQ